MRTFAVSVKFVTPKNVATDGSRNIASAVVVALVCAVCQYVLPVPSDARLKIETYSCETLVCVKAIFHSPEILAIKYYQFNSSHCCTLMNNTRVHHDLSTTYYFSLLSTTASNPFNSVTIDSTLKIKILNKLYPINLRPA